MRRDFERADGFVLGASVRGALGSRIGRWDV